MKAPINLDENESGSIRNSLICSGLIILKINWIFKIYANNDGDISMTRALLQMFVCLSFIQSNLAGASDNYPYEPEIVELEGVLVQEQRFGSPNYGETPEIDERLNIYALSLKMPITVGTRDSLSELNDTIVSDVDKIQVDFVNDVPKAELAGKAVILQGTLSKSIWGREFYPVVLTVRYIVR